MFVTNWISTTKIQKISEITNFFRHYFLSRTEVNFVKDFFASVRDVIGGRSGSYESTLREAKDTALREMADRAASLGCNAIVGIDLDYETVGKSGSMLMVTCSGTAVVI